MECKKPTKKFPEGRTGTMAGYRAHQRAGEESCTACKAGTRLHRTPNEHNLRHKEVELFRKRAEKEGLKYQPYSAGDVTATHGLICRLCKTPVDLNATGPTSAVLDFMQRPLLKSTTKKARYKERGPGNILSNVRWFHRACRDKRTFRGIGTTNKLYQSPIYYEEMKHGETTKGRWRKQGAAGLIERRHIKQQGSRNAREPRDPEPASS